MASDEDEPNLVRSDVDLVDLFDLARCTVVLRLSKGQETVSLKPLVVMLREVIEDVDSGWCFGGVGNDFYLFEEDGLVERDCELLGVIAESLALPCPVPREEI